MQRSKRSEGGRGLTRVVDHTDLKLHFQDPTISASFLVAVISGSLNQIPESASLQATGIRTLEIVRGRHTGTHEEQTTVLDFLESR